MAGLQIRVCSGQVIVALRGELDATGAAGAAAAVAAAASVGQPVVVDLAGLDFIDCSALRALAGARQRARRDGGDVLLAAPHGPVLRLLALTGLNQEFGIYPSVAAASTSPVQAASAATGLTDRSHWPRSQSPAPGDRWTGPVAAPDHPAHAVARVGAESPVSLLRESGL